MITQYFAPAVVGSGTGTGAGVDPDDIGYDLILLLGGGNMSGAASGAADTTRYDTADPRAQQYGAAGTYASVISQGVDPLSHADNAVATGLGPGTHFARWYLNTVPPNRRVLLVPAAYDTAQLSVNTTPLGWRRGVSGNLYAQALVQAQAALTAAGPNARIVAALWVHGDTDGANNVAGSAYRVDLDALITGLRLDLSLPTLPFIIGQMVPEYLSTGTRAAIDAVHSDTPYRLAYVAYVAGPGGRNTGDGSHYNQDGQRLIGHNLMTGYLAARDRSSPLLLLPPAQVTGLAASLVQGTTLTLTWAEPASTTSYIVEQKLTSSSSWTQIGTPTAPTLAVTGLTALTSYDFRVSALNNGGTGPVSATLTQVTNVGTLLTTDAFTGSGDLTGRTTDVANGGTGFAYSASTGTALAWSVTGGRLVRGSNTASAFIGITPAVTNVGVSIKFVTMPTGAITLHARRETVSSTPRTTSLAVAANGGLSLATNADPANPGLVTAAAGTVTAGAVVALRMVGTRAQAVVNGVVVLDVTTNNSAAGFCGFAAAASSTFTLDDFEVRNLTGVTL